MKHSRLCKILCLIVFAVSVCTYQSSEGGWSEGVAAYKRGDFATVIKEWRPLAEQGNARARYNLGIMYFKGVGVSKDYKKAAEWIRKAAEQGNLAVQTNLGTMYHNGHGVLKNNKVAVKWFRKAAEQGLAGAQFNLGNMYHNGWRVLKDDKVAVKWYRKGAEQGDVASQITLGLLYSLGSDVLKDDIQAHMWFNIASVNEKAAIKLREKLEKKMSRSEIQEATRLAREWMRKHRK